MRNGDAVTTYIYNIRGQLIQIIDALGQVESFTYDANGLAVTRTDRNGTRFDMTYDNMGRLVRENAVRDGSVVGHRWYSFHPTGIVYRVGNENHEIMYIYDAQGRLIRQEETGGIVKTYRYNAANNVTNTSVAINGAVHVSTTNLFNSRQQVLNVTSNNASVVYSYDPNGNRVRTTSGNGDITDYTFNLANLVTNVTNRRATRVLSSFAYLYYLDGNVRQVTEADRVVIYTYDQARRLTREEVVQTAQSVAWINVNPDATFVERGQSRQFNATVSGMLNPPQDVTWSLEGNNSSQTRISTNGLLTVASDETSASITVRARSAHTRYVQGTASVTIIAETSVSVSPGWPILRVGGSRQFTAEVVPAQPLRWHVSGHTSNETKISENGVLTVGYDELASGLVVRAEPIYANYWGDTARVTVLRASVCHMMPRCGTALMEVGSFWICARMHCQRCGCTTSMIMASGVSIGLYIPCYGVYLFSEALGNVFSNESDDMQIFDEAIHHCRSSALLEFVEIMAVNIIEIDEGNVHELYELSRFGVTSYLLDLLGVDGNIHRYVTFVDDLFYTVDYRASTTDTAMLADVSDFMLESDYLFAAESFDILVSEHATTFATPFAASASGVREYTFDNRGNRIRMVVSGTENYTVTYTYDLNNRLLGKTRAGSNPQTTTFTYDRNGNQITSVEGGQTERRTYDAFNRLISVVIPGMTATYDYRADGLRHSKTVNGIMTQHVWNGMHIVAERNASGAVINRFNRGLNGQLIRSDHHGFYLFNARGDVVQRVGLNGIVKQVYRYDAFGVELNPNPSNRNPFRFAGEYWDFETNTIYLRARNYSPRLGRFTQPDPHWTIANMVFGDNPRRMNEREDPLGLNHYTMVPDILAIMQAGNLYVYTINNPVHWIDPSGRFVIAPIPPQLVEKFVQVAKWVGTKAEQGFRFAGDALSGLVRGSTPAVNTLQQVAPVVQQVTRQIANISPQTQRHIMEAKHHWGRVVAEPNNWQQVNSVINNVMSRGTHASYGSAFQATMEIGSQVVKVTYQIVDGVTRISNAWVVTR